MKTIIILAITVIISSCHHKKKNKETTPQEWLKVKNDYPKDTTIHQDIWYYNGKYCLQTWVQTENQQTHLSQNKPFDMYIGTDTYAPYNKDISGTFEFIKKNKAIEYNKADSFVQSLYKKAAEIRMKNMTEADKAKLINDSIKMLQQVIIGKFTLVPTRAGTY
jgi:hypothetical protein